MHDDTSCPDGRGYGDKPYPRIHLLPEVAFNCRKSERTIHELDIPIGPGVERVIARRLIALAWAIDPSWIEDAPSLTTIAQKLGCDKTSLSVHAAAARRRFGIRNRASSHGWNFKPNGREQS